MAPELLSPGEDIKPDFTIEDARGLLREIFGLDCLQIEELNGYDDKNYRVEVGVEYDNRFLRGVCKEGYVLKIMNSWDSRNLEFVEGYNALLQFLEENHVNSPKLVPTKTGSYYATKSRNNKKHIIRLLEFIPGALLHQIQPTNDLLYQAGRFVARLDLIMKKFRHPAYDTHASLWHLDSVPKLKEFVSAVGDHKKEKMVLEIVQQFEDRVLSVRNELEPGMIHGDFNEQNIIVEELDGNWKVKAVIDFNDSQYSCYLYELAVATAYAMLLKKDSIEAAGHLIAGYFSVKPIAMFELELLKLCICARLCQSVVMGAHTYLQHPENPYLLTTTGPGWELLSKLWTEPEEETLNTWKSIATQYFPETGS